MVLPGAALHVDRAAGLRSARRCPLRPVGIRAKPRILMDFFHAPEGRIEGVSSHLMEILVTTEVLGPAGAVDSTFVPAYPNDLEAEST